MLGVVVGRLGGIGYKGGQAFLNDGVDVHFALSASLEALGS